MMPISRQMSAMTAPMGRWRISAAICSGSGQSGEKGVCRAGGPGGGSGGPRLAAGRRPSGRGFGVQPWSVADNPGFERLGTQQAASDAAEDQGDVTGGEYGIVAAEPGRDLPAVRDERVHESEEAAGAARFGVGRGLRGGHERNEEHKPPG